MRVSAPATLSDIANRVGVSPMTVSRALRQTGRMRDTTRRRILKTARDLNYRTNVSARSMKQGAFGCVGLLMSPRMWQVNISLDLQKAVLSTLDEHDNHLILAQLPDEELTDRRFVPRILRQLMADGLIIGYDEAIPPALFDLIDSFNIPSIWLNSKHPHDCVHAADLQGAQAATDRLIQSRHRHIAYVDLSHCEDELPHAHYSAKDRVGGYVAAMRKAGLAPRTLWRQTRAESPESRIERLTTMLAANDRPTAIISYGQADLVHVAAHGIGLARPDDLLVVDFRDRARVDVFQPTRSILLPQQELGQRAAELVLTKIANPRKKLPALAVPLRLEHLDELPPPRKK